MVCFFVSYIALGDWDICCLFWATRSAVTAGPGKPRSQGGSSCPTVVALGLSVFLCNASMVKDSSSLEGRLRLIVDRDFATCSVVSSVSSGRRSRGPVSGLLLVQQSLDVWSGNVLGFLVLLSVELLAPCVVRCSAPPHALSTLPRIAQYVSTHRAAHRPCIFHQFWGLEVVFVGFFLP